MKTCIFILFLILSIYSTYSQRADSIPSNTIKTLKGTVTDEKGNPLFGSIIRIMGTKYGVIIKKDGKFRISINFKPDIYKIKVSYIGFNSVELDCDLRNSHDSTELNLVLTEAPVKIDCWGNSFSKIIDNTQIGTIRYIDKYFYPWLIR